MRLAQTSLMIAVLLSSPTLLAEEAGQLSVTQINNQISSVQSQLEQAIAQRRDLEQQVRATSERLNSAREASATLERERRQALEQMNRRYRELVDNPTLDINEVQQAYQQAVAEEQRNNQRVAELSSNLGNLRADLERTQVREHSMQNQLATYQDQLQLARVDRLVHEFNASNKVQVQQQVTCDRDETISQCENRADMLAKQRASRSFLTNALENLTEYSVALENREEVSPDVRVLGATPLESGFTGGRQYNLSLEVEVEGRMRRIEACQLLKIDPRYCADNIQAENEEASDRGKKPSNENALHRVLVRSNVHNDSVIINGERYGSTPVEVMLQPGEYDIAVSRRGYTTYSSRITVNGAQTMWAELSRLAYDFAPGELIQDALSGEGDGPTVVVVPSGSARVGNLQRASEDASSARQFEMAVPVAFGVTPVTVGQFRRFVQATGHVTSAERGAGCRFLNSGSIETDASMSWESPGYTLQDNLPVTCVSLNDAKAYTNWLSRSTGQSYRLPSQDEWEYAARGGSTSAYWWGQSIGTGRANCVTCGSAFNGTPSPVNSFAKNPYGLEDVVGNVWEWTNPSQGEVATARGGAYNFAPALARMHVRLELFPEFSSNYLGFRVLRDETNS